MTPSKDPDSQRPALWQAFLPIIILIGLLGLNVFIYRDGATSGPNQTALILAAAVAAIVGWSLRVPFEKMLEGIGAASVSHRSDLDFADDRCAGGNLDAQWRRPGNDLLRTGSS